MMPRLGPIGAPCECAAVVDVNCDLGREKRVSKTFFEVGSNFLVFSEYVAPKGSRLVRVLVFLGSGQVPEQLEYLLIRTPPCLTWQYF